ncbi:MAG: hypothetical protein EAX86_05925 [Candidatus Heimdallarchaeota archaeon]|nr:hypothetical protein [Candidatus Heimdallarchaeota archaeon]
MLEIREKSISKREKQFLRLKIGIYPHILALSLITIIWSWIYLPFLTSRPAGIDFSAHLFRIAFLKEFGLAGEWNPLWYTGTAFLDQYAPGTTFILWLMSLVIPIDLAYVSLLIMCHLIISMSVYFILILLNRSVPSGFFAALFIMTLPSLNINFMFYSRAPTQLGLALLGLCLCCYYAGRSFSTISLACLLSITHYMIFGFLIVIVGATETAQLLKRMYLIYQGETINERRKVLAKTEVYFYTKKVGIWVIPFLWVFLLMPQFFQEPINLIMLSSGSLVSFTDGPGGLYWVLRVLRDFIYNYISLYVFMFLGLFACSIWVKKIQSKEISLFIATLFIIITGFFLFYKETNELLPLAFRGMDVLRFILVSQLLLIVLCVRGIEHKGTVFIMTIIILLPLAEAHNGIINFGYLQFDDDHWLDLEPLAEDLKSREGFYYVCPKGYQGDHMAYLPILTNKPYFDGWNPPGCRLSWFRDPPPSSSKYRPDPDTINDIIHFPEKYGVKWMFTGKGDYSLFIESHWQLVTLDPDQSKLLWETSRNISLVDVFPTGNAQLTYESPTQIRILISSTNTSVDLLIKVAHHPSWKIRGNKTWNLEREDEIGFIQVKNVTSSELVLEYQEQHLSLIFSAFLVNLTLIIISVFHEYKLLLNFKKWTKRIQLGLKKN